MDYEFPHYEMILNEGLDGFAYHKAVYDEKGNPADYIFLHVNSAFERLTGLRAEDVTGKKVTEVIPGIRESGLIEIYGKLALSGRTEVFEQYFEPLERHYCIKVISDKKEYFMTIFQDITLFKKNEELLVRINRLQKALLKIHQLFLSENNEEQIFTEICEKLYGDGLYSYVWLYVFGSGLYQKGIAGDPALLEDRLSAGKYPGCVKRALDSNYLQILNEQDPDCKKCLSGNNFTTCGCFLKTLSHRKQQFALLSVGVPKPHNSEAQEQDLFNTITDSIGFTLSQYRIEKTVRRTKKELDTILFNSTDSITRFDTDWNCLLVNNQAGRLMGESVAHIEGRNIRDFKLFSGVNTDELSERLSAHAGDSEWTSEFSLGEGQEAAFFQTKFIPERDCNDIITSCLVLTRDITGIKKTQSELVRQKEEAESLSKLKSSFLANISHELRTPLNGIWGMASLLQNTPLQKDQREFLGLLKTSAANLQSLVQDLLDFTQISTQRLTLDCKEFNLHNLAAALGNKFEELAVSKGLTLSWELAPDTQMCLGDKHVLTQILVNLLSNAVKYTDRGSILLDVFTEDILVMKVVDTGVGIDKKNQEEIFDVFRQLENPYVKSHQGTGIGLAIVKKLVERLEGTITVDSRPGKGSSFTVKLPIAVYPRPIEPEVSNNNEREGEAEYKSMRVLIVEDEAVNSLFIENMLEESGIDFDAAATADEALSFLYKRTYDLILMDIGLPGKSGIDITKLIRGDSECGNQHTPVFALTAHAHKDDQTRCIEAGMNEVLVKPINEYELLDLVSNIDQS